MRGLFPLAAMAVSEAVSGAPGIIGYLSVSAFLFSFPLFLVFFIPSAGGGGGSIDGGSGGDARLG